MIAPRNGSYARSIMSALAVLVAAGASSIPGIALANPGDKDPAAAPAPEKEQAQADDQSDAKADPADADDAKADAHPKGKHGSHGKAHAKKSGGKHHGKTASAGKDGSQRAPSAAKPKKTKKTASRENSKKKSSKKGGDSKAPQRPCLGDAIGFDRSGLEAESLTLLDCHGAPRDEALARLSVLARPWGVARPAQVPVRPKKRAEGSSDELAAGIHLLDPGLLSRIDTLARKFERKPVSLVSGYRPQSRGSLHQTGHAVDLRIAGVSNTDLVAACRTLTDTGCGYYPNSSFVHVDVRDPGTGVVYWIDASGPGEPPRYVTEWPPRADAAAKSPAPPEGVGHSPVVPPADATPYEPEAAPSLGVEGPQRQAPPGLNPALPR